MKIIGYKVGDQVLCVSCAANKSVKTPIYRRKVVKLNCDECKQPLV
jgi:hypothetical protein